MNQIKNKMYQIKNKKILITGGAGFIGSHLAIKLVELGAKVSVTVKYNSIIDSPRLIKIWNKINVIEADLRNTDSVLEMTSLFAVPLYSILDLVTVRDLSQTFFQPQKML